MSITLSVVIVTYNAEPVIARCIENLLAVVPFGTEIIVVDNNSADRTLSLLHTFPGISIISNLTNRGYGTACNQGFRKSTGMVVFFMNPDAFPEPLVIDRLCIYLKEHPRTGACSGKLVDRDHRLQYSCRTVPTVSSLLGRLRDLITDHPYGRLSEHYLMATVPHDKTMPVAWLTGSFLAVNRHAFEEVGGFDEHYFLYCEDMDLCVRMAQAGYLVEYVPEAGETVHYHQRLSMKSFGARETCYHLLSMIRFYRKRLPRPLIRQDAGTVPHTDGHGPHHAGTGTPSPDSGTDPSPTERG